MIDFRRSFSAFCILKQYDNWVNEQQEDSGRTLTNKQKLFAMQVKKKILQTLQYYKNLLFLTVQENHCF